MCVVLYEHHVMSNAHVTLDPGFGAKISHGKYKSKGNTTFMGG